MKGISIGSFRVNLSRSLSGEHRIWVRFVSENRDKGAEWHVTLDALVKAAIRDRMTREELPRLQEALQSAANTVAAAYAEEQSEVSNG